MNEYVFAKKGDELVTELAQQVETFQNYCVRNGLSHEWKKNKAFYENRMFGTNSQGSDITDMGEAGELKALTYNHFRNVLRHQFNIIVGINPTFNVTSRTTSSNSRRTMKVGRAISDYYFKKYGMKKTGVSVAEKAIVYGDGFFTCEFDPTIGREIAVGENEKMITEGDFVYGHLSPFHVFYDYTRPDKLTLPWITTRKRRNKFDIAAIFPKNKEKILGLDSFLYSELSESWIDSDWVDQTPTDTDDIYVYSTYHRKTAALPKGKYVLWCGSESTPITLYEGDNPYLDELPVFPMSPADRLENAVGFAEANVLRAPQMVLTTCISNMVSNLMAFGTNNIWAQSGANLTIEELSDGMNFIQSAVKPEVISFYKENPDLQNMFSMSTSTMETLSGQNAVIRGNVSEAPNLKSGVAIATVINLAREYSQYLVESYYDMTERVLNFKLKVLKVAGSEERLIEIAGKRNQSYVDTFKREDIEDISSISIERVNPISKSSAGQVEIAMELLKIGKIDATQFFEVVNTGNIDSATESDDKMWDYINSVKDALLEGKQVTAIAGVNHQILIREVQALLQDIDLITDMKRQDIVKNITTTIQGHMTLLRNGDEISALIYGGQPPVPAQVAMSELGDQTPQLQQEAAQAPVISEPAQPLV